MMIAPETHVFAGSSHLAEASFDPSSKTLSVTFQDGRTYEAEEVKPSDYYGLIHARSAGSYFYAVLESAYSFVEV